MPIGSAIIEFMHLIILGTTTLPVTKKSVIDLMLVIGPAGRGK
jgi:hypothetical protein